MFLLHNKTFKGCFKESWSNFQRFWCKFRSSGKRGYFTWCGRSRTQSIYHALKGAEILKEREFPVEILKITERHIGAGIPKEEAIMLNLPPRDYLPITLEEKIVAHADNLINGIEEVSLDFVIQKWSKKMGSNHPSLERLIKLHNELFFNE